MDYVRFAIQNPVKVTVGVLLLILFGFLALSAIPVQLVPNVDQPVITVETNWTGRDPLQIEKDIVEEQEDKLKGVSDLRKMASVASEGRAAITLEFNIGADMTRALQEVSDKLREVPQYPQDVDEPVITVADSASQNAIAWMVLTCDDPDFDVEQLRDKVEDHVKPYLERAAGISQVNVYGGRDREVHIRIDPGKLAQRGITFDDLRQALRLENVNVSAGQLRDDRLDWRFRTVGQFYDVEQIRKTIVADTDGGPIRVRDLGDVVLTLAKRRAFVRSLGQPAIALNAIRRTGSNVLQVVHGPGGLAQRVREVNDELLPALAPGLNLQYRQVYDETIYIYDAVELVRNNLWIGGSMAVLALLLFLRRFRPTVIIALAIPVSVVGTFVVMTVSGRNINVVSLAGLAFAVGMVIDNAIVVLENIDRHLSMDGASPAGAAYDATRQVWGAILASTLTTLAVFFPVIFMAEEAGQLFRDIAIAVMASVALSLIVAVTVIPSAAARWLKPRRADARWLVPLRTLFGLTWVLNRLCDAFTAAIRAASAPNVLGVAARVVVVAAFTVVSIAASAALMPDTSYLPTGNRNLIFGMMFTPPSYTINHNQRIAHRVESSLRPYWEAQGTEQIAALPPVPDFHTGAMMQCPPIDNYFFVSFGGQIFMGASSRQKQNVRPLAALMTGAMMQNPGTFAFATQPSIFGRTLGSGNAVELDVVGTDIDKVRAAAAALEKPLRLKYGKVRADPANFNLPAPEMRVQIDRTRAADLGVDVASLGLGVQALVDGVVIGDYVHEGESIDLLLVRHPDHALQPEQVGTVPIAVMDGDVRRIVPLATVATFQADDSPQSIKRIEELRAVTITVEPPPDMPLETALHQIEQVSADLRDQGAIDPGVSVRRSGTADKLTQVREALIGQWHGWTFQSLVSLLTSRMFLALLVTFLLMAALFESFLYPFVIMFTVPLATVGGFIALALVRLYDPMQQLDVLTMLGFVILIGVVVNNAILIVHQALNFMHGVEGDALPPRDAICHSVRTRIRPIFMTTMTSVCGMLPLVLMPGSGSELYRGLGSVVVGGMAVSAAFTLIVVPLLFSLVLDARAVLRRPAARQLADLDGAPATAGSEAG